MIIHSVTPIPFLLEEGEGAQMSARQIAGGHLEGYHTPEGFKTARLYSTDPALYLKNEYSPGSILRR